MTTPDNKKSDSSRDEVLAGEYVLGVLPLSERLRVEQRIRQDREFALIVSRWQANLADFNEEYVSEASAPSWIYKSIETQLFENSTQGRKSFGLIWNSLQFWRGIALVSVAAALFFAANAGGFFQNSSSQKGLVATLSANTSNIGLVSFYDRQTGIMKITPVAAGTKKSKSLELWLIEGSNPPRPLGVLPDTGDGQFVIPQDMRNHIKDGVTLAVSLEPYGGSPTGKPTGPVIASGKIGAI